MTITWIRNSVPRRWFRTAMLLTGLAGVAILPLLGARAATAAEKGVHFDPGSPAGTEYALPLAQARNEGSGKSGVGKDGSVEPAPLFGEGVGGPGGSTGPGGPASGSHSAASGAGAKAKTGVGGGGGGTAPRGGAVAASRGPLPTESAYSSAGAVLIGALVLIAAVGAGYGLRRLSHPQSA